MRLDKNTIIGFALIFLILAGYQWYEQKTRKEKEITEKKDLFEEEKKNEEKESY